MALAGRATHVDRARHRRAADLHLPPRAPGEPRRWRRPTAMGRPGLTLGVGPSHAPAIEDMLGLSYEHAGRHTEEYVAISRRAAPRRGGRPRRRALPRATSRLGRRWPSPCGLLVVGARAPPAAGGGRADRRAPIPGWPTPARSRRTSAPRIAAAAESAGRPAPRIVAGLPVAVHDDVAEARERRGEDVRRLRRAAELPAHPRPRRRRRSGRRGDRRRRGRR